MKIDIISLVYKDPHGDRKLTQKLLMESSFIGDAIVIGLHKETFFDCRRMNFMCKESDIRDGIREIFRVADMDIPFSRDYFDMNVEERQKYLAETYRIATKMWCDKMGWDYSLFKAVIDEVEENNYIVNRSFRKVKCKNGDMNAKLVGIQSIDRMDLYVDIYRKRTFEKRIFIYSSDPNFIVYEFYAGSLNWEGDTISLLNTSRELVASIKVQGIFPCNLRGNELISPPV